MALAGAGAGNGLGAIAGELVDRLFFSDQFSTGQVGGSKTSNLQRRLEEHRQRLDHYRKDPDAFDNLGLLKNAPSDEVRQRIIQGRIRYLENEIRAFKKTIRDGGGTSR